MQSAQAPEVKKSLAFTTGLLTLAIAVVGCGPSTGKISGKVTINGEPLPGGIITFVPLDAAERPGFTTIGPDGSYHDVVVATGEVAISVQNKELDTEAGAKVKRFPKGLPPGFKEPTGEKRANVDRQDVAAKEGKYVPIPPSYYDAKTSGLKYTVVSGEQTHEVQLRK